MREYTAGVDLEFVLLVVAGLVAIILLIRILLRSLVRVCFAFVASFVAREYHPVLVPHLSKVISNGLLAIAAAWMALFLMTLAGLSLVFGRWCLQSKRNLATNESVRR